MEPYTLIAPVYDYLLRHVDYEDWYQYMKSLMLKYTPRQEMLLELGCGTGRFGAKFAHDGYRIYGMDRSLTMLSVARVRAFGNYSIFCGDITQFHIKKRPDFIFAVHDTMNYITEPDDLLKALRCVREIMHDKTIFLFDLTTEYNINENFNGNHAEYYTRGQTVEWDNRYNPKNKRVYSFLTVRDNAGHASTEEHVQRLYTIPEMKKLLAAAGFMIHGIYGDNSFDPPQRDTIMINFITGIK